MPTTEEELVMTVQHILAQFCRPQLQWIKTFRGANFPTDSHGLLLRLTNGSEFQLIVVRTKRPRTSPVKQKGRLLKVTIPEE